MMLTFNRKIILLILGLLVAGFFYHRVFVGRPRVIIETRRYFDTLIDVHLCLDGRSSLRGQEALAALWRRLEEIEQRMSAFCDQSDLAKIAKASPNPVSVHPDTYEVLKHSLHYFSISEGAFDVTVKPLVDLWRQAAKNDQRPSKDDIAQARKKTGMDQLRLLDHFQVQLLTPGMRLDLGGIAKGYGVDEAVRILQGDGFFNFFINAGGDIFFSGRHCTGRFWVAGIRDPSSSFEHPRLAHSLKVHDAAITTSGDYERYYVIDGQTWSHIIDPRTGYPASSVVSATVVAPTAMQADAVSTALCVLGGQQGAAMVDALGQGVSAYIFEKSGPNDQLITYRIESEHE